MVVWPRHAATTRLFLTASWRYQNDSFNCIYPAFELTFESAENSKQLLYGSQYPHITATNQTMWKTIGSRHTESFWNTAHSILKSKVVILVVTATTHVHYTHCRPIVSNDAPWREAGGGCRVGWGGVGWVGVTKVYLISVQHLCLHGPYHVLPCFRVLLYSLGF